MQAGAYQNGTWVVGAAKCGVEEGFKMIGQSAIIAPSGEIVAQARPLEDEVITARCDLDLGQRYATRSSISPSTASRTPTGSSSSARAPCRRRSDDRAAVAGLASTHATGRPQAMSTVIKGGTIVAADLTYEADVLIEGEQIAAIGKDLKGDKTLDASGAYVMPGGIDPHTHLEMPFMGTTAAETSRAARARRCPAARRWSSISSSRRPTQSLLDALQTWEQARRGRRRPTIPSTWRSPGGASRSSTRWPKVVERGINTFKHFMAYKGALMVNDDEMFASFQRCAELGALPLVHAENGDVVAALQQKYMNAGTDRPGGARLFAAARSRGRGDQPRHHDRRRRRRAGLYRPCLLRAGA